jgi:replicative DNA helicase
MASRRVDEEEDRSSRGELVKVHFSPVNEQVVLAASIVDAEVRERLTQVLKPDQFLVEEHRPIWAALLEMARRKLAFDWRTLQQVGGDRVNVGYLRELAEQHAEAPEPENLAHHVDAMHWDRQRAVAIQGPLNSLLEALRNPAEAPERIRALARHVGDSFTGAGRSHIRDSDDLVTTQVAELRRRMEGHACWPYGVQALDQFEEGARDVKGNDISGRARMIPGAAPGEVTVLTAVSGAGKALALDTAIATRTGWTTMEAIRVGEFVFGADGQLTEVVAISEVMRGRSCYEVGFSDGSNIVADGEHIWRTLTFRDRYRLARRKPEARERSQEARRKKLVSASTRPRVSPVGSLKTTREIRDTLMNGENRNHAVPLAKPLEMPDAKLPVDPYVLGVWLGDGTSASVEFTNVDDDVIDEGSRVFRVRKQKAKYRRVACGLRPKLRELGLLKNKHIPMVYLRASFGQRLALLQGLMDTGGCCSPKGECNFDNMNQRLVLDVAELMSTMGIKTNPKERLVKLNGRVVGISWRFTFRTELPVFRVRRKLKRKSPSFRGVHKFRYVTSVRRIPSVPVRCIQVAADDGMYLAGVGMVPTHNSTMAAHLTIGLARQRRRVLYGSWEPECGMTLELIATMALGWSRSEVTEGRITHEELVVLEEKMHQVSSWVSFMENPFQRVRAGKESNARNLDLIHQHIVDSGCAVFVADLWDRCLVDDDPSEEKRALWRQHSIAQETRTHNILLAQQRLKDVEMRADKRPTREGIMGSSAWVTMADTILAPHRPALFKKVEDDKLELIVWKQRWGVWPAVVEFEWDAEFGSIANGKTIPFEHAGQEGGQLGAFLRPDQPKGPKRRSRG